MSIPTPLAIQVAGIAADLHATAEHRAAQAGVVAALHALILATLARLFTCLEDLVTLWQSGQLPAPAPRLRHRQNQPAAAPAAIKRPAANRAAPAAPPRPHSPNPARAPAPACIATPPAIRLTCTRAAPQRPLSPHSLANRPRAGPPATVSLPARSRSIAA